jgi:diguanylate cyclase (GGDEF)-like protein
MRVGARHPVGWSTQALGRAAGYRRIALRVALIALTTSFSVFIADGGDAFWLCVPAVLLACASTRTRLGAALSTATVLAGAGAPAVTSTHVRPLPSLLLAVVVVIASVTVLVVVRERLERERDAMRDFALTDPLTGIANRRSLLWRAEYEIARHTRAHRRFAVVMLDLDGFKLLNDRFGHAAGDDLLRDVAAALKRAMRAQDTVARLGGDEFCVLAPETEEPGVDRLAARIAQALSGVSAGVETVGASLGFAVFPRDGVTAAALMQAADERLLSAKREPHSGRRVRSRAA